ncbi:hypothetical protein PHLCEN_2v11233 [Hermanssonia centrifuga]|uniref:EKC/KEOPS complex subunit CGI121 n=1 Tax=Hermanssonia centrifuga TaxID=98765 RepID=A0A2R6NKL4_9APHY|nr:hypothetical protein PHLCEN_2v11233 [Hermanssonia centrifuga]
MEKGMVSRLRKVSVSKRQAVLCRRLLPLPETVMESFSYPQFPRDVSTVYIALFDRVSNAAEIRSRLVKAVSMTGPEGEHEREIMNFAFIDARLICSRLHLQTAIYHAAVAHIQKSLRTKTVHSEVLWILNPSNNISEAIRRYGVSDDSTAVFVVRIANSTTDVKTKMQSVVKGDLVPISDLQNITDWGNVKKYNKLNNDPALKGAGPKEKYVVNEIVFTPKAAALFTATGVGLFFYFRYEKQKLIEERQKELEDKQVGRPNVGGPFSLSTHDGKTFTEKDLLGKWSLIYFGFTNCPDICPEELDKMSDAVEKLDPARDSVKQVAKYVGDFHPRLVGLTGDYNMVKATCKAYRVYFSTPPSAKATDDYLVDHSIFFYFMDPNGQFVDAFGKATSMDEVVARVQKEISGWEARLGKIS